MISVVMPLYNASKYICDAVDSVILQNVECELIVVDDCSTDGSVDVLLEHVKSLGKEKTQSVKEYNKDFDVNLISLNLQLIYRGYYDKIGIIIVQNDCNRGAAHTRNAGVRLAGAEDIAFLDADDMWTKDKLSEQIKVMKNTGAVMCCTSRALIGAAGRRTGKIIESPEIIDINVLKKSNYVNCSSVLVKKSVMLEFPMEHSEAHEDYLAWLRIVEKYGAVRCINEPLLLYRLSEKGKSRNKIKSAIMTYRTYVLAGYGRIKSSLMMFSYIINGIKKYKLQ